MRAYTLTHLVDSVLLRNLSVLVRRDRVNTATLLAYIAEVDERRLYLPAGYPSMYAYCLAELHLSEDAAYKRIRAARTAREYPELFAAVSEGRLHLTAILLLAPHLKPGNLGELIAAATHKGRDEIELWIARRFPRPEGLRLDAGISALPATRLVPEAVELAPGPVDGSGELAPGPVGPTVQGPIPPDAQLAPGPVAGPRTRVAPLSPGRFALEVTIGQATHDKLRYAQSLLGHSVPSGDVALVLDRALDSLIVQLEKRKLATARQPRRQPRPTLGKRHVPAHVRREVWERDGGQCTYVGQGGYRCAERVRLEFDHVDPVARGGRATTDRMRLRCRGHNQFAAEQAFGAAFMRRKREAAQRARGARNDQRAAVAGSAAAAHGPATAQSPAKDEQTLDVIAGLRALGMRAVEARQIAEASRPKNPVTVEEHLRLALRAHRPRVQARIEHRPTRPGEAPFVVAAHGARSTGCQPATSP